MFYFIFVVGREKFIKVKKSRTPAWVGFRKTEPSSDNFNENIN
jgi:hypothetical protein